MAVKILSGRPQMLKEVNSSMIERIVFEKGPLSKPNLARETGLSLPTINKLVDYLVKNARLSSIGQSGTGAGRKAMLYEINRNSGCLLACYYKEGSFLCRLVDMLNNTVCEARFPLDASSARRAEKTTFNAINAMMKEAPAEVKIIGVGLPGVVGSGGRLLGIPQIAVWEGFNLEKALGERYQTAIYVENNVKLSAMGYFCLHNGKQDTLVYLYVGNGIGSGVIINGQLLRGWFNFSGEIGFMAEPFDRSKRNFATEGGYMETLTGTFVDYSSGELRGGTDSGGAAGRENLIAILGAIAVNHVVIVNPGLIVLAGKIFDKGIVEGIGRRMKSYLPPEVLPRIMVDSSGTTGLEGLIQICREFITTGTHLVESTGLSLPAERVAV